MSNTARRVAFFGGIFALIVIAGCVYSVVWIQQQAGRKMSMEADRSFQRMDDLQDRFLEGVPAGDREELARIRAERDRHLDLGFGGPRPKRKASVGPSIATKRIKDAYYPGDISLEEEGSSLSAVSVLGAGLGGLFVFFVVGGGAFYALQQLEPVKEEEEGEEGEDAEGALVAASEPAEDQPDYLASPVDPQPAPQSIPPQPVPQTASETAELHPDFDPDEFENASTVLFRPE